MSPIQRENTKRGTTEWKITQPSQGAEIAGFASLTSVQAGQVIKLYISTSDSTFSVDLYRMGWYQGLGGRKILGPIRRKGMLQTTPPPDPNTGLVECNWTSQISLKTGRNWTSGFYLAKLTAQSGAQSYIIFVVRNDSRPSALLFQSSVATYQAYNGWGGKSLYPFDSKGGVYASKVSFNRPYTWTFSSGESPWWVGSGDFMRWEYFMVRFLEREGYDVSYSTDIDTHENPNLLFGHKAFLVVGHDEYWSWEMRQNVTWARDQGVGLGFFSANDCWWQVRFEPSAVTGQKDRTLVCYKLNAPKQDPDASNPATYYLITTRWDLPHGNLPGDPEDPLIGIMYNFAEPVNTDLLIADASNWIFNGTGLANGDKLSGLVGYEADAVNKNPPPGLSVLAHSPYLYTDGTTRYADMTVYQAASGATVFATGSIQWGWGLDNGGLDDLSAQTPPANLVSVPAQQITRNVLSRFLGR